MATSPVSETLTTGTMTAYDGGDRIYFHKDATQRIYYLDVVTNKIHGGSMYPYAAILFDYTRRAMPMNAPQSLTNDEVYAVTAYIYNLNGLVPADAVVDSKYLAAMKMPNRDAFITDTRPDVKAERCMSNCKPINTKL
jgi:hypothetical protein